MKVQTEVSVDSYDAKILISLPASERFKKEADLIQQIAEAVQKVNEQWAAEATAEFMKKLYELREKAGERIF